MPSKLLDDQTKEKVLAFLPEALGKALHSYKEFMGAEIPDDAKGFSAHHTACKVAIAHIELLLKLGRMSGSDEITDEEIKKEIAEAEAEMKR
ncbi:MAG: hypothetical protein GC136_00170 [Alphaproteobacteria bacterium]|nr:hypothetical protein [Alphaproteobacteria bacterium]